MEHYDVTVVGAGLGGVAAALQAAREGCSVLVVEHTDLVGGQLVAAGVTSVDEYYMDGRYGIYREFRDRVRTWYQRLGRSAATCYWSTNTVACEPQVAQRVLLDMLSEAGVELELGATVTDVLRQGARVTGAALSSGRVVSSKVTVDASEDGYLLPIAGARYRLGNRLSPDLDPDARLQDFTWTILIKEYPDGVPGHLRLPAPPPGYSWESFRRVQLETPFPRNVYAPVIGFRSVVDYRGCPDPASATPHRTTKTSVNVNYVNDVPQVARYFLDPQHRFEMDLRMRLRSLQFLYYVQDHLGLPWSVCPDAGYDRSAYNLQQLERCVAALPELAPFRQVLAHFPPAPYVRECRRVVGRATLTCDDVWAQREFPDAAALNGYPVDIHGATKPHDVEADLDTAFTTLRDAHKEHPAKQFQVPLGAFVPQGLEGLLVCEKNLSQSRLANGATRVHSSVMINGQAVGKLAAELVRRGAPPVSDQILVEVAAAALKMCSGSAGLPTTNKVEEERKGLLPPGQPPTCAARST